MVIQFPKPVREKRVISPRYACKLGALFLITPSSQQRGSDRERERKSISSNVIPNDKKNFVVFSNARFMVSSNSLRNFLKANRVVQRRFTLSDLVVYHVFINSRRNSSPVEFPSGGGTSAATVFGV